MGAPRPLLIAKTGDTVEAVRRRLGDFDWMFKTALGGRFDLLVREVHEDEPLPDASDLSGVIVTGSPASVTELEPWAARLSDWLASAVDGDLPVLGVCYGHQILGHALGGEVRVNPACYEIGTVEIELTDAGREDPLLGALEPGATVLRFNAAHADAVVRLPAGATRLASNPAAENQAFRVEGKRAWGVQFHPEFDEEITRLYVEARADKVRADAKRRGLDPEEAVAAAAASVKPTPHGPVLLRRFVETFVSGGAR